MKSYLKKPVVAVAATVCLLGGITPLLADAYSAAGASYVKVVMNDEGEQVTRYHLQELAQNDPDILNMLLKSQADHLYIIVEELNLDTHLRTYMEKEKEQWEWVYQNYYDDIWLEVRFTDADEKQQIVSVRAETEDDKAYVKGIVTPQVTQVVVTKPDGDTILVKPTSKHTFAVSFAVTANSEEQVAKVEAYANTRLVDRAEVKLLVPKNEADELLLHSQSVLDLKKEELTVRGLVKLDVDEIYVTYGGTRKKAAVKKLWDGVGSFGATLKEAAKGADKVLLEMYRDGQKQGSIETAVQVINDPAEQPNSDGYALTGTAVLDAKKQKIQVKGTLHGYEPKVKASLAVIAPAGVKQTVKPNAKGEFVINITLAGKHRAFDGDAVELALYVNGKLKLEQGIPVTKQAEEAKAENPPKGKANGYWKKDRKWDEDDRDEDDDDEDDDDDDDEDDDDDMEHGGRKGKKHD